MNKQAFLSVKDLYKSFKTNGESLIQVLKGVDFNIYAGETIAIVGASGIGKSTLLNIIGTLDRPDKGSVFFNDEDVFTRSDDQLACLRNQSIGFVFQFHHLLPEFNALENAMMPLLIKGENSGIAKKKAEKLLVRVGLKDRLTHRIGKLSGGEQQRVALARALVHNPSLFLADEPTGNLDRESSEQVHKLLMELNQEFNMTMIVVTHSMKLAGYMQRKMTLFKGKLTEEILD
ncbi:lipoprotein release complex - ATP binding subunit [Candidatus Magnetomoraceae bacterium gMMP-15]